MIKVNLTTRDGTSLSIDWDEEYNLMETIRGGGVSELQGLCGGQVSCATCHVYIDPAFASYLPPVSEHEDDLLENSDYRRAESRLSCQIPCIAELDGVAIQIAPEN
jgi:2Fe-2S ferredoxin